VVMKFTHSVMDTKCACFCESEVSCWGVAIEIGQGEYPFWAWEAHNFGVHCGSILRFGF
jgi:hypothetical protein